MGTTIQPHNGQHELWDLGLKEIEKCNATVTTFHSLLCIDGKSVTLWGCCLGKFAENILAALQRLQLGALKIIMKAKIEDTWSCPGMSVENTICLDKDTMAYRIMNKHCPESVLE